IGQMPLRQVPKFSPALTSRDHDFASCPQEEKHHVDVSALSPSSGLPAFNGSVFKFVGGQRTLEAELFEDVAAKRLVLLHPATYTLSPGLIARCKMAFQGAENRIVFCKDDGGGLRPVLKKPLLIPQKSVQVRLVTFSQTTPEHQKMALFHYPHPVNLQVT
ncbi:MAG: hypothetical protein OEY30_03985, partial [Candidatus Bathyarchaeota archaeon]|nr:hypothetical protein [Candidatus Bathyarchaeota archaeon]